MEGVRHHRGGAEDNTFREYAAGPDLIAALDWLPLPSLVLAPDSTALGVNQAWAAFSAAPPEAARGNGWLAVVDPLDRVPLRTRLCAAAAAGQADSTDIRLANPAGGWSRWWWRPSLGGRLLVCVTNLDEHQPDDDDLDRQDHSLAARLLRRPEFVSLAGRALRRSSWSDASVAVVAVGLDGVAGARDDAGRPDGAAVRSAAVERILGAVGHAGAAALAGQDEFVVLCGDLPAPADAGIAASRIREAVARPLEVGEVTVSVATSVGLATASSPGETAEALIERACLAMRSARLDRLARLAAPSLLLVGLDARTDAALDLAGMVVDRLFSVGLTMQLATDAADGPAAGRLRRAVDELDAIIRDVRTAVFDLQRPGCAHN